MAGVEDALCKQGGVDQTGFGAGPPDTKAIYW